MIAEDAMYEKEMAVNISKHMNGGKTKRIGALSPILFDLLLL